MIQEARSRRAREGPRTGAALLALVIASTACSTVRTIAGPLSAEVLTQVNHVAGHSTVSVDFHRSAVGLMQQQGKHLHLDSAVARVIDRNGGEHLLPTSTLRRVEVVRRAYGAMEGLLIGGVFAALGGGGIGYALGGSGCGELGPCFDRHEQALIYGAFAGVLGALTGALVGGLSGHRDVFVFE